MLWTRRTFRLPLRVLRRVAISENKSFNASNGGPVIDSNTGAMLDPDKAKGARQEELDPAHKQCIDTKVPLAQARAEGETSITLKWIDRSKGDRPTTQLWKQACVSRSQEAERS